MRKIIFAILVILLVANVYAQEEQVDWGDEKSWTAENVQNHPEDAINTNPDRAIETAPNDAAVRKLYFTQGDIKERIEKYPGYAAMHFEQPGNLGGEGGKIYLKTKSGGNVEFDGEFENVQVNDKKIQNVQGFSIQDISSFPKGTKIKPNGKDGFIVILPNQNEKGIVLSGGAEQNINFNQQTGSLEVSDGATTHTINDPNVAKLDYDSSKGGYRIEMANGDRFVINTKKGGTFDIEKNQIHLTKGIQIDYTVDGEESSAKINGNTQTIMQDKGYKITGDFNAKIRTQFGVLSVPSDIEAIARKEFLEEGKKEDIAFCFKCGEEPSDRTVTFDGSKILAGGKISASLEKADGEIIAAAGQIDGVVYEMDDRSINIVQRPAVDDLRKELISKMEEKRKGYEERENKLKLEIKKLELTKGPSAEQKQQLELMKKTLNSVKVKLNGMPPRLTTFEVNKMRDEGKADEAYGRYTVESLNKYQEDIPLVMAANAKANQVYMTSLNTRVDSEEYKIYTNKFNLFSQAMHEGSAEPIKFAFGVKNKPAYGWEIRNNQLIDSKGKQTDFYANINLKVNEETKKTPEGVEKKIYAVSGNGDISSMMADLAPTGTKGAIKEQLKGKDIVLGDLIVDNLNNQLVLKTNIENQRDEFNRGGSKLAKTGLKAFSFLPGVEKDPASQAERALADNVRNTIYLTEETSLKPVNDVIDTLANNNIIPATTAENIKTGTAKAIEQLQKSPELEKMQKMYGFEATIVQDSGNNEQASFKLVLNGIPNSITVSEILISTDNKNLIAEASKHLGKITEQKTITDIYKILLESDFGKKLEEG